MMQRLLFISILLVGCATNPPADRSVTDWYREAVARGNVDYKGVKNAPPVKVQDGYRAVICSGAGCPEKTRFTFTAADIQSVTDRMDAACTDFTEECGLKKLGAAMVEFEMILYPVWKEAGRSLTWDCVDQTSNGLTYLLILEDLGRLHGFEIVYPGHNTTWTHFFDRLKAPSGDLYRFDLYHRGRFGVPTGIVKL